jgi:hypothetical protein
VIDMTLLPERFHKGWVAVAAYCEGAALHVRSTLQPGDILYPVGLAASITVIDERPETLKQAETLLHQWRRRNTLTVGIDMTIEDLYPDLWGDWKSTWT